MIGEGVEEMWMAGMREYRGEERGKGGRNEGFGRWIEGGSCCEEETG